MISELNKRARSNDGQGPREKLSPTAIAFLVPLFIFFLFGPLRTAAVNPIQLPTVRREDAREKLNGVTEISSLSGKYVCMGSLDEERSSTSDSISVLEKECAICLSTLHTPSPPEPAKLAETTPPNFTLAQNPALARAASVSGVSLAEKEEILRLKICGHEFHAECLISWFLIWRYDCPICRTVYYKKADEKKKEEQETRNSREQEARLEDESGRRRDHGEQV
ncbi:hypothetical protein K469DRAFT_681958 [Zopfia rhizophila CBS 207.26]|uniref:RING-type domain-containing protein n=1 Tax=Zopfia rhizophila CBS 207.26 TaxID=1314779 RepID=A0A6A6EVV3_9PEZI|nr:hypothetical protein K469DRAFT_681958 [Zopfia rhizophila CBS 207.26]